MSSTEVTGKVERGIGGKGKGEQMGSQTPEQKFWLPTLVRGGFDFNIMGGIVLCV